jgi:hypothetical protein
MLDKSTVFKKLSAIDVKPYVKWSEAVDSDNAFIKLPYLPWQSAHALMMEHYPQYEWNFRESQQGLEVFYFADGTAEVSILVSIGEITTYASKAVTGAGNRAVKNPNADDIHNAKMRCRVRALAELGLGFDLWVNPDKYPFNPIETQISKQENMVSPDKVADDITHYEADPLELEKNERFAKLALSIQTEKQAKEILPKARRNWVNNRKWDKDEFHKRWEAMCTAKGFKK